MRPPCSDPVLHTWRLSDGYELRGRLWSSRTGGEQAVLYLHGIQSHGGWFAWSASVLATHLGPVILADRRGSGLNVVDRGDTPGWTRWLVDLDDLADWARGALGVRRFAVVGVSWGGKLAAAWAARHPEAVTKLLLIAPGFFPAVDVGWLARARIACSLLADPRRRFPIPLNDASLFTDNPAGRAFIESDPIKLTHATARFYWQSAKLDHVLRRMPAAALRPPVTLWLAGRDRIIRNEPTADLVRRISRLQAEIRILSGAAHTLEFEPDPAELAVLLTEWAQC